MAPFSLLWFYGNLSAYMDSYFMLSCYPNCVDGDSQWILPMFATGQVPGTFLVKPLIKKMGVKWAGIITMVIGNLGLLGSAWSLQVSVAGTAAIYGILIGTCTGTTALIALQLLNRWAPENTATFMATATSVPTLLSVIQNQIITAYVNPNNLKADSVVGPRTYFSQPQILSRVPGAVIILAAMTFGVQFVGYALISEPPPPRESPNNSPTDLNASPQNVSADHANRNGTLNSIDQKMSSKTLDLSKYGSNELSEETRHDIYQEENPISGCSSNGTSTHCGNPNVSEKEKDALISYTPYEMVSTPAFYAVFFFGMAMEYGLILKANFYKQFGQVYIKDDQYLTLVGSLVPVTSICSRLLIGHLLDKNFLSIKSAVVISLSLNAFLCSLWYLIAQVNPIFYLFLVLGLGFAQGVYYIIAPICALQLFGPEHLSVNYPLSYISIPIISIIIPIIVSPLLHALGWFWLFTSCSIFNLLSLCLTVAASFNTQTR
ncbi:oxalate:formate antiporter-like isoform X1 [Elysia marginata]|uniref:Oxalate:formate antiporter-like isoform X1 n=1 Tax=Elysia marginata TaxID=1093978 RepID=A0AAV4IV68_9GAST|nr:oxalate:formate antiporter-like isoform X1 [Elysia marginata]